MNDKQINAAVTGLKLALDLVDTFGPIVQEAMKKGEVSVADQEALAARMESYRSREAFKGPDYQTPIGG